MLTPDFLRTKFAAALPYDPYVATGQPHQQGTRRPRRELDVLSDAQRALVRSFTRRMPVLVTSGMWCGDCAQQCPMLDAVAQANPDAVAPRFLDRDAHADLSERIRICGGLRVPTVVFLNEDFEFVHLLGDRTLSRYRAMAAKSLGAACPLPGAPLPQDELNATLQDWLDEFERAHLVLRLSPKLRQRHND